jgi:hypothetical protein
MACVGDETFLREEERAHSVKIHRPLTWTKSAESLSDSGRIASFHRTTVLTLIL